MLTKIVDLFFPRACGLCGQKINERYTCRKCLNILEYYRGKVLISCCSSRYYDQVICAFEYKTYMKNKMLQYKFEDKRYIAKVFGDLLAYRLQKQNICADVVIPVPIHEKRRKQRGYNQSAYVARVVSEIMRLHCDEKTLIKIINNPKQSLLDEKQRIENVKGVYSITSKENIRGKRVLLIDDIFTTGVTVNECAKVLKEAGASEVIVATVLYGR